MADTAADPAHPHRSATSRGVLRPGWPRALAAIVMIAVGAAFVITTLVANLYSVGPAFDRLTNAFRPIMTQQSIQTAHKDIAQLSAAGTEIQTKLLPALAQQLNLTPDQLNTMMSSQFPDVAAGLKALPTITPSFDGLITTLDQQRPLFASADAIPTKNLPAATVPWGILVAGIISILAGVIVWFAPRTGAAIATVLGLLLIIGTFALSLPGKASDADQLNANLKPVYTPALITQADGALATLSAMGKQMQSTMLPALATQLKMQPAQLEGMLQQGFPATAAALAGMPASLGRFQTMVAAFKGHLSDYNTMKPVALVPIVWLMVIGGAVLVLVGGTGLLTYRRGGGAPA